MPKFIFKCGECGCIFKNREETYNAIEKGLSSMW